MNDLSSGDDYAAERLDAQMAGQEYMIPLSAIVDRSEIARRTGVTREAVSRWFERRQRTRFPEPIIRLNEKSFLWDWREVEMWHRLWKATRGS